jgi:hypothetical protein
MRAKTIVVIAMLLVAFGGLATVLLGGEPIILWVSLFIGVVLKVVAVNLP